MHKAVRNVEAGIERGQVDFGGKSVGDRLQDLLADDPSGMPVVDAGTPQMLARPPPSPSPPAPPTGPGPPMTTFPVNVLPSMVAVAPWSFAIPPPMPESEN